MAGLRVGIVGAGGVGIATASALILQGLAGRVTLYDRTGIRSRGEALDYLHALPLLPSTEIRGRSYDEFEPEDVMVVTVGHHIQPGETRLDVFDANVAIVEQTAAAIEAGGLPRVVIVVTNPLDVLTEYLVRRWDDRTMSILGSGTSLDTLRFGEKLANECGVHPRSIHAWVIGEHGDSSVFLFSSVTIGALPLQEFARAARDHAQPRVVRAHRGRRAHRGLPRAGAEGITATRHRPGGERPRALHRSRARHHHPGVGPRGRRRVRQPSLHPRTRRGRASRCGR